MNKKTIAIVSIALTLAILAVAVIATFPTYLFESQNVPVVKPQIDSDKIVESPGDDVGVLGGGNEAEAILPMPDDQELGLSENTDELLSILAEIKNAKLLGEKGAFSEATKIAINKLGIFDKKYYLSRHYTKDIAKNFIAYDISATEKGNDVSPSGLVKLVVSIPDDYDLEDISVYYLLSNGVQKIDCSIDKSEKTASIKVSQMGVYILVENADQKDLPVSSEDTSTESEDSSSNSSSTTSSDTSSDASSDNSSTDSSNDSSTDSSSDVSSDNTSSDTSSDSSSQDENKESMDGWTPWY